MTTDDTNFDRRPIAARGLGPVRWLAATLARAGVTPNFISVLSVVAAAIAGGALAAVGRVDVPPLVLYLVGAAGIQLRLLANMLDGMVAVEFKMRSAVGELFNEVPDRISDTVILVGAGYALGGESWAGWFAACAAMFVTYARALGRSLGFPADFRGPMAKQQRMFLVTVAAIYLAFAPSGFRPIVTPWAGGPSMSIMDWTLLVIAIGSLLTAWRRLATLASNLRSRGT
jgi:phosphatidylglycerophosphate synthase